MAVTDVYSHGERIRQLQAIQEDIKQAIVACKLSQRAFSKMQNLTDYVRYDLGWDDVKDALDIASGYADAAAAKLAVLRTPNTGFVFQYEWTVGKMAIASLQFSNGGSSISVGNAVSASEGAFTDTAGVIPQQYDLLIVSGTTSNNGFFTVSTGSDSNQIVTTVAPTSETCTTAGASVKLIRRGN